MNLAVHLHGQQVGVLRRGIGTDFTFEYLPAIVAAAGEGAIVLSQSLPVRAEPFDPIPTRTYFEGLLPEGARREEIARRLRISSNDGFALLADLGRDCAGAVSIFPEGEDEAAADGAVDWLSRKRLEELVEELPRRPLGVDAGAGRMRLSLAGVQRKLALVSDGDRFGLPGATPSSVLVKPEYDDEFPNLVANELFCLTVARAVGIPTARTEMTTIGDRTCLISHRFDRDERDGRPLRLHQEDLCQALGVPTNLKYQADSGPGFPQFRWLLGQIGRGADVATMVRAAALNYTLGNSDAHGKNFAILFAADGRRLAPLYDVVSTAAYESLNTEMAMSIGDVFEPAEVELPDWLDMSHDCDLAPDRFFGLVRATALEVRGAAEAELERAQAGAGAPPVLERIVAVAARRSQRIAVAIDAR